jgi:2-oxoglutarate ferredoxin oxidoreductase subunit gamma
MQNSDLRQAEHDVRGDVERAICFSGIGGQGVQLASQVVARAALIDGREVQLFGSYGGMMRGGNTETTIVVSDDPVESPPTVADAWAVVLMHHDYAAASLARRQPGGLVLVNSTVYEGDLDRARSDVVEVPATDLAIEVGNVMAASMVMAGALAAATGLVSAAGLEAGVRAALPPYRRQHIEHNIAALRAGAAAAPPRWAAWAGATATGATL